MTLSEELRARMEEAAREDHGINLHVNPDGSYNVTDEDGALLDEVSPEARMKISEVLANTARLPGEDSEAD